MPLSNQKKRQSDRDHLRRESHPYGVREEYPLEVKEPPQLLSIISILRLGGAKNLTEQSRADNAITYSGEILNCRFRITLQFTELERADTTAKLIDLLEEKITRPGR